MIWLNIIKEKINHVLKTFLILLVAVPIISIYNGAKAVEGDVFVDLKVNGVVGGLFGLGHVPGGTPSIDWRDYVYYDQFDPDGLTGKSVANIGGTYVDMESESSEGEPVGTTCNHSLVIRSGKSLTVNSPGLDFTIDTDSMSGYTGYNVLCDGVKASTYTETGTIPAGTYNGPTQISLGNTVISFERDLSDPNGNTYIESVGPTGFTAGVTITNDGWDYGDELCNAEIYYMPVGETEWTLAGQKTGLSQGESFEVPISELEQNTQYFVTSHVYNSKKDKYGDTENITTTYTIAAPTVFTGDAKNITQFSANLEGILIDDGTPTTSSAETRFVYYTNGGQQLATDWQVTQEGSSVNVPVSGLTAETLYWYYFEGRNSEQTGQGETNSFSTLQYTPPLDLSKEEPNTIIIQNYVKALFTDPNKPHDRQGNLIYTQKSRNLNGIDANDVSYVNPKEKSSKIVSLILKKNSKGEIIGFYELSKDARPVKDPNNSLIELSVYSPNPNEPNITTENYLKFWLPNDANSVLLEKAFGGKPLTIQRIPDSNELKTDPNFSYPVWDIRSVIKENNRKLPLKNINNQKLNNGYAYFNLSTSTELLDINGNGTIEKENDHIALKKDIGKTGPSRSDIASMKNYKIVLGIPDGKVDLTDENAFVSEYNKRYPEDPIIIPSELSSGDFESGQIEETFTTSGDLPWMISDVAYSGDFSAKSGDIGNSQISILEAVIDVSEGDISFWRKVSSESGCDGLIFYIDDIEAGRWSGELDWEEMIYQISPGTHSLKWVYQKDSSVSDGYDSAWIDNLQVIPNS